METDGKNKVTKIAPEDFPLKVLGRSLLSCKGDRTFMIAENEHLAETIAARLNLAPDLGDGAVWQRIALPNEDREIMVMNHCASILGGISPESAARAAQYLMARFGNGAGTK